MNSELLIVFGFCCTVCCQIGIDVLIATNETDFPFIHTNCNIQFAKIKDFVRRIKLPN